MAVLKGIGIFVIVWVAGCTLDGVCTKAYRNYKNGKTVFGKPVKKTVVRTDDYGMRMIFAGQEDYIVA